MAVKDCRASWGFHSFSWGLLLGSLGLLCQTLLCECFVEQALVGKQSGPTGLFIISILGVGGWDLPYLTRFS